MKLFKNTGDLGSNEDSEETKLKNNLGWKASIYFILFESSYWMLGHDLLLSIVHFFKYNSPIIKGSFTNVWLFLLCTFGLIFSFWALKQFVMTIALLIRGDNKK